MKWPSNKILLKKVKLKLWFQGALIIIHILKWPLIVDFFTFFIVYTKKHGLRTPSKLFFLHILDVLTNWEDQPNKCVVFEEFSVALSAHILSLCLPSLWSISSFFYTKTKLFRYLKKNYLGLGYDFGTRNQASIVRVKNWPSPPYHQITSFCVKLFFGQKFGHFMSNKLACPLFLLKHGRQRIMK